ncbi:MAG: YbaK/EbsC family protein [Spirochaetota bacterium]|nr:YbaK/EbsC family protein [Spirochaetota bacterium]
MNIYEEKMKKILKLNNIHCQHLSFNKSCHSVQDAASAANASTEDFVKNICMIDQKGNLIVAIVKGSNRVSTSRVGKALNIERPRTATPDEILERTGYPCGGTPSFGYKAIFLIDPLVMEKDSVYTGGGSENSLIKISVEELQKSNQAKVIRIRK